MQCFVIICILAAWMIPRACITIIYKVALCVCEELHEICLGYVCLSQLFAATAGIQFAVKGYFLVANPLFAAGPRA
jgi:hypothetical protein